MATEKCVKITLVVIGGIMIGISVETDGLHKILHKMRHTSNRRDNPWKPIVFNPYAMGREICR